MNDQHEEHERDREQAAQGHRDVLPARERQAELDRVANRAMEIVPVARPSVSIAPSAKPEDLVKRLELIQGAADLAMTEGTDYGKIPGTDKPTLLKPGAEKLGVLFELDIQLQNEKLWEGEHLTVISRATVFHAPSGVRLGYGEGIASTREKKYAKRQAPRVCPECGTSAVIKGKREFGGGWLCWKRRDGCGATWDDASDVGKRFANHAGEIDNPNIADTYNTVDKIASKRARVDAVLAVTGASAIFTQDVEDMAPEDRTPDAGASSEDEEAPRRPAEALKAEPSPSLKGRVTRELGQSPLSEELRVKVREGVAFTTGDYEKLARNLNTLNRQGTDAVPAFLAAYGLEAPSDVPGGDTTDLDEEAAREAELAAAAAESGDPVEQSLTGMGVPANDDD